MLAHGADSWWQCVNFSQASFRGATARWRARNPYSLTCGYRFRALGLPAEPRNDWTKALPEPALPVGGEASLTPLPRRFQIRLRCRLVLDRRHLVGVDAHHDVGNVIVDLGEPMPGAGRNDDDVAGFELMGGAVANRRAVVAGPIEQAHGFRCRGAALHVGDVGAKHERA